MRTYGAFENQAGVMAHRPPIFKNVWGLLTDLAAEAVLPKRALELALVTVSLLNDVQLLRLAPRPETRRGGRLGGGAAQLLDYADHPELDEADKLVVEYAIAVTNGWNRTGDEIFARLRRHFSEAQIVELTWRTALCGAFNRFNDILQLDLEPGVAAPSGRVAAPSAERLCAGIHAHDWRRCELMRLDPGLTSTRDDDEGRP